jgi:hypothetical protein
MPAPERSVPPRTRILLGLGVIAAGSLVPLAWRREPPLSPEEHRLVGRWGYRITDPAYQFGTQAGLIRNAWDVLEFTPDHVFRQMVVSGDDPGHRWVMVEGRWRVVNGRLELRSPRDALWRGMRTDVSRAVWKATGLVLDSGTQPFGGPLAFPFEFPEPGVLELRNPANWSRPLQKMAIEAVPYRLRWIGP